MMQGIGTQPAPEAPRRQWPHLVDLRRGARGQLAETIREHRALFQGRQALRETPGS